MKKELIIILFVFTFLFFFVSADFFPKDYPSTYDGRIFEGGNTTGAVEGSAILTENYICGPYKYLCGIDWYCSSNWYCNNLAMEAELDFAEEVDTNDLIFSMDPIYWTETITDLIVPLSYEDGWVEAGAKIYFLDSLGEEIYFDDGIVNPGEDQIVYHEEPYTYYTPCWGDNWDDDGNSNYIQLQGHYFDKKCNITIVDPVLRNQIKSIRLEVSLDSKMKINPELKFYPKITGPFVPQIMEDCSNNYDDDLDGYKDCNDPDCNGYIIPNQISPSSCLKYGEYYYAGIGWNGTDWEETSFWCDSSYFDGYVDGYAEGVCCPYPDRWNGTMCLPLEDCDDLVDNDLDGYTDCADLDCAEYGLVLKDCIVEIILIMI